MGFFRSEQKSVSSVNLRQPLSQNQNTAVLSSFLKKIVVVIALLLCVGALYYFFVYPRDPQIAQEKNNAAEIEDVVKKVGMLMVLPEGEEPTLATVSDPEKLKDQPFFKNAQLGDKVILYTKAQKAILYRPSLNKIIEVAPINLTPPQPAP